MKARYVILMFGPVICLQVAVLYGAIRGAPFEKEWHASQREWESAYSRRDFSAMREAANKSRAAWCGKNNAVWYLPKADC